MTYISNKKALTVEAVLDVILMFTWMLPVGVIIGLNNICNGWNEGGVGFIKCSIPLFGSFYRDVMGYFFISIWGNLFFDIVIFLIALGSYICTTCLKIRRIFLKKQSKQHFMNNLFGIIVWGVSTCLIFDIIWEIFF